jgi:hypothetical protein
LILGAIKNLSAEEIQAMLDAERDAERQTAG